MRHQLITMIAIIAVMVALTGAASALETAWQLDGKELPQHFFWMKNDSVKSLDLLLKGFLDIDEGTNGTVTLNYLQCANEQNQANVNCGSGDIKVSDPRMPVVTATRTSIWPNMLVPDEVSAKMQAPISRKPGTKYSFEGLVSGFAPPRTTAGLSLRVGLVGSNITGKKCNDQNGDGICGQTEPGLAGWTIILRDENGTEVARTTTDASGNYAFRGPVFEGRNVGLRGTFTVEEVPQDGWTQTGEAPVPPGIADVIIDETDVIVNFANHQGRSITGMKCKDDASEDGICGAADPALPGWTIVLSKPDGTEVARTTTDANGKYEFKDLQPGTYIISEVLPNPNDWRQTGPKPVPPGTWTVTLTDQDATGKDFANVPVEKPCVERCKVVGWGTLGPKAAPEVTFKIFAFTDFMPEGAVDVDDSAGNHIKATKIESVVTNKNVMPMTGEITGEATFNGDPVDFTVKVTDGGDPGRAPYVGKDTFDISIPAKSYHKSGTLTSGNLQVIY